MSVNDILSLTPAGFFALGALLCLLFEATGTPVGARKKGERLHITLLTLSACAAVLVQVVTTWSLADAPWLSFGGALVVDRVTLGAQAGVGVLVGLAAFAATSGLREREADVGDAYALLLFHGAGLSVLVSARELLTITAALMLSLAPLVPLAAIDRRSSQGTEAAVKLVQLCGVLMALLGFAAALQFGTSNETDLCLRPSHTVDVTSMVSAALVLVVLLSLLAAVPLHSTQVDLVHGPPPFVGGLIATTLPLAATTLLLRWLSCEPDTPLVGSALLWGLEVTALLTLTFPALAALDQTRVDRVVAHLACAQAGPLLVAVVSQQLSPKDLGPILLALSSLGASVFGAVIAQASLTSSERAGATWERWSGAGRVYPLLGLAMVWLWSSLAGLPGTIGFASRVVTAQAAFGAGLDLLGIVVVVAPVLAAAPVLRLTIFLFAKTPDLELRASMSGWRTLVVVVAVLVVFLLGIFPMPLLELGRHMGSLLPV